MRILEHALVNYLGNDLDGLECKVQTRILEKLRSYEAKTTEEYYLPALDYLLLANQLGNEGISGLAKNVRIAGNALIRIFYHLKLPMRTDEDTESYILPFYTETKGNIAETARRTGYSGDYISRIWRNNGLKPVRQKPKILKIPKEWDKGKIIGRLRKAADELGHSPTQNDVDDSLYYEARYAFGSWNTAKSAASLEVYQRSRRGAVREILKGRPTATSRIRNYLNNNPSTMGEIIRDLQLTESIFPSGQHRLDRLGIEHVGPKKKRIYYLRGQEAFLPNEYQNNAEPTR